VRRSDAEYADHALAPAFYAQSWATLHYALTADPIFGRRIMEYIGELSAGGSRLRAAERLIGEASGRANRNIASFLRRKRIPTAEIRITNALPLAEASVRELDPIESTMRLGELLLRMGTRNDEALALFEMARRQRPGTPRALIGAG